MTIKNSRSDKVSVDTFTVTTHHVQVNLADLLAQYGLEDQVVLMIQTPSGRSKRVTLTPNFFIAPHHGGDHELDPYYN